WHCGKFEIAQIVGGVAADDKGTTETRDRHTPIENNARLANRFSGFIEHLSTEESEGRQLEPKMLCVEARAGDDGRPGLLVLFLPCSYEAASCALQRVLALGKLRELEATIFGCDHASDLLLRWPGGREDHPCSAERFSGECVHGGSGNPKVEFCPRLWLRLSVLRLASAKDA